jgi:hypothetical protein
VKQWNAKNQNPPRHRRGHDAGDHLIARRWRAGISNMTERVSRMIRVERGAQIPRGVSAYSVPSLGSYVLKIPCLAKQLRGSSNGV